MKPKQGSRRARDLENRETRWLRYRSGLVALLDRVRTMVDGAPEELASVLELLGS